MVLPQTLSKLLAHRDGVKVTIRMPTEMYWPYNTEPYIWPQSTQDRLCQGQIAYSFLHPQEGDGEGLERACAIASLHRECPEPSTEARITGRRQEALKGESSRDGQERTESCGLGLPTAWEARVQAESLGMGKEPS